jgi:hypothetical protein
MILQDGRRRTLLGMLYIMGLERNLIFVNKVSDVGVHIYFRRIHAIWSEVRWY